MSWAVCVRSFHRRRSSEYVADEWRSGWTVNAITGVAAIIANHKTGTVSDSVPCPWAVEGLQLRKEKADKLYPLTSDTFRSVPLTDRKAHKSILRAQFLQAIIDRLQQRLIVVDDNKSLSDQFDVLHNNTWPSDVSPPWADGERLIIDLCTRFGVNVHGWYHSTVSRVLWSLRKWDVPCHRCC